MDRRQTLDLSLLFPITEEASARLMVVKANCLHSAGVITNAQRLEIHAWAAQVLHERCLAA
jgi:hypothetical protein